MREEGYRNLALQWQPGSRRDRVFQVLAVLGLLAFLGAGWLVSRVDVPREPRTPPDVPERVAQFIARQPPGPPPAPKPQPRVEKTPKVEEPAPPKTEKSPPRVERRRPEREREPLTESQAKAREKAAKSGLLAHMNELQSLTDTGEVAEQLRGTLKHDDNAKRAAGLDADVLTVNAEKGSGGVNSQRYAAQAGDSELAARDSEVSEKVLAANAGALDSVAARREGQEKNQVRSQEEITLLIDQQKGQLQALYNRARRRDPTLGGKLVLSITIAPSGQVSQVEIVSSELHNPQLEARIVARVKLLQFAAKAVPTVTVNYPIEFLP